MPQIVHKDDNSHGSLWLIFVTSVKFTFRAKEDGCIVFIGRHTGCQSGTALLEFVSSSKALVRLVLCAVFLVSTHNSSSVFAVQFFTTWFAVMCPPSWRWWYSSSEGI